MIYVEKLERRGSSGAQIHILPDKVIKLDTERTKGRVREQGLWLLDSHTHLPWVSTIRHDGYEMEVLDPIGLDLDDPMPLLTEVMGAYWKILDKRRTDSLTNIAYKKCMQNELRRYIIDICSTLSQYFTGLQLIQAVDEITWPIMNRQWTHGDPILDNVMRRPGTNDIVIIDPIPPASAIPSYPYTDVGRFVQSAAGYEKIRYGGDFPPDQWMNWIDQVISSSHAFIGQLYAKIRFNDWAMLCLLYAIIGMLRGARTAPDSNTKIQLCVQAQNLTGVLRTWMR